MQDFINQLKTKDPEFEKRKTQEFIDQLETKDQEYKKYVSRFKLLNYLQIRLIRCFWPLYETSNYFSQVFSTMFRLIYFGIIFLICGDFAVALCVYAGVNLAILIPVTIFKNKVYDEITTIVFITNGYIDKYEEIQHQNHSIVNGKILLDDGIVVGNGTFEKQLDRNYGQIQIYNLNDVTDYHAYSYQQMDLPDHSVELKKHIASEQFNKNFAIICKDDRLVEAISFFSPTKQLNMIRKLEDIKKFRLMKIEGDKFSSQTAYPVKCTRRMEDFDECPSYFFKDVDRYCAQMTQVANTLRDAYNRIGLATN